MPSFDPVGWAAVDKISADITFYVMYGILLVQFLFIVIVCILCAAFVA